ncbi:MAG: hypothetical protein JRI31_02090 [Deltaproteobacteria bacterium]|nr:hypothetical protein [Deltaproteobacteria bacterium]
MRKFLVGMVALVAAVALALPTFAVEFKYGGMYRWRFQAQDNMSDANSDLDDTANWIDQRLRMYFTFVGSENLKLVTKWEADTLWGLETGGRHGGGDINADAVNLEMKNVYLDFMIPNTPVRAKVGVQGLDMLDGWIFSDDASIFALETTFDPIKVKVGYIAAQNIDTDDDDSVVGDDDEEDVDDWFLELKYAEGPLSAAAVLFYQYAHDADWSWPNWGYPSEGDVDKEDNHLIDLGFSLDYKMDMAAFKATFIKNFGSYDIAGTDEDEDYDGWMVEAEADFYMGAFTFTLGGFWTSDDFAYPKGRSHYWAEIAGAGTLEVNVNGYDWLTGGVENRGDYVLGESPRNIWTIHAGAAWQALDTTKVTFNYYYIGTDDDVLANEATGEYDDSIGHELDLYIDQKVVDGLTLRLVGAYLIGDDALSTNDDDDNVYEVGARLLWKF